MNKNINGLFYGRQTPNKYEIGKEKARDFAYEFQRIASGENYSFDEYVEAESKLIKIGKRYGLLKEFKENGVI